MIPSNSHKQSGSVFIEVMFALVLLATFGTSLFMIQISIFSKTSLTHNKLLALQKLNTLSIDFAVKKELLVQEKKPLDTLLEKKEIEYPIMDLDMSCKAIPAESSLHQSFGKTVKIIQGKASFDQKKEQYVSFVFDPPQEEDESKKGS